MTQLWLKHGLVLHPKLNLTMCMRAEPDSVVFVSLSGSVLKTVEE